MPEKLRRGVYLLSGEAVLVTPSPDQIEKIAGIPKAIYFSTIGQDATYVAHEGIGEGGLGSYHSPTFLDFSIRPLSSKIRSDLKANLGCIPEKVGVRGTACSLDGNLRVDDFLDGSTNILIKNLEETITSGSDREDAVNIEPTSLSGDFLVNNYALRYLVLHPRKLRFLANISQLPSNNIFPLLLIYDLKYSEGTRIKPPADKPDDPILSAYVLDYPER